MFHVEKTVRWRRWVVFRKDNNMWWDLDTPLWTGKQKTICGLETCRLTLSEEIQITSLRKVLLTVFWDMRGSIYCHYLEDRRTVNSESYCKVLRDKLRLAIWEKRRGLIRRDVILQHDSAPPHAAHLTRGTLEELGWEVLIHPPYSTDLRGLFQKEWNKIRHRMWLHCKRKRTTRTISTIPSSFSSSVEKIKSIGRVFVKLQRFV